MAKHIIEIHLKLLPTVDGNAGDSPILGMGRPLGIPGASQNGGTCGKADKARMIPITSNMSVFTI